MPAAETTVVCSMCCSTLQRTQHQRYQHFAADPCHYLRLLGPPKGLHCLWWFVNQVASWELTLQPHVYSWGQYQRASWFHIPVQPATHKWKFTNVNFHHPEGLVQNDVCSSNSVRKFLGRLRDMAEGTQFGSKFVLQPKAQSLESVSWRTMQISAANRTLWFCCFHCHRQKRSQPRTFHVYRFA